MKFYYRNIIITLCFVFLSISCGCSLDEEKYHNIRIKGQITNELTDKPIRYPALTLLDKTYDGWIAHVDCQSDVEGRYEINALRYACDPQQLAVLKSGFESQRVSTRCTNDLQTINFKLTPTMSDYEIQIQGTVYDLQLNTVGEAIVTLWEREEFKKDIWHPLIQTSTDTNGFYEIKYYVDYGCLLPVINAKKTGVGESLDTAFGCYDTTYNKLITVDLYFSPYLSY